MAKLALFVLLTLVLPQGSTAQLFLSDLDATKSDPVYTTFEAHTSRSEYVIDEGYRFVWYDPFRGLIVDAGSDSEGIPLESGPASRYRS